MHQVYRDEVPDKDHARFKDCRTFIQIKKLRHGTRTGWLSFGEVAILYEMKEILELQLKTKEDQLVLVERRIRIAQEIESKAMGASWEEMQEFLGHSYEHIGEVEERGEQLIDPVLFAEMSNSLVVTANRIRKDIAKLKSSLEKLKKM